VQVQEQRHVASHGKCKSWLQPRMLLQSIAVKGILALVWAASCCSGSSSSAQIRNAKQQWLLHVHCLCGLFCSLLDSWVVAAAGVWIVLVVPVGSIRASKALHLSVRTASGIVVFAQALTCC
jgi:hypothetical protein